ncbi:hypothetical protein NX722_19510 [Endozoicomonas gorgoniicola]|uniref:VWFA domain-containing protein n=1 Tax=Endozoicomonas gorgoniicola TaxID=1234144 RepID=A0ABT3MZG6_9GAMM|nr:hypothetical protein [Endozoicomonas gorgoniicola]MCW7554765.1 hypothetical protein [Endozoicomonas gorgoniicola]
MAWNLYRIREVLLLCLLWLPAQGWCQTHSDRPAKLAFGAFGSGHSGSMPFIRGADPAQLLKLPMFPDLVHSMPEHNGILLPPDDSEKKTDSKGQIPNSLIQKPRPELWEEDRERVNEALKAFEEQDVSEFEWSEPDDNRSQIAEILQRENQKTATVPGPPADPDDFKGQQVYRQKQAAAFRDKTDDTLKLPFARTQDNFNNDDRLKMERDKNDSQFELDTGYVYQGSIKGVLSLPSQNQNSGSTSKAPSAPPSDAPPSYEEAIENGGYIPLAERTQQTLVIRSGGLAWEPTLPIASDVIQVLKVNPRVAGTGINHLPDSTQQLDLLGESQAAVLGAASLLEIPVGITSKFSKLREYHLDLIIDDSGSMGEPDTGLSYEESGTIQLTRMDELKFRLRAIIPLLAAVSAQGITIRCLNAAETQSIPGDMKVRDKEAALRDFVDSIRPSYGTPLNGALRDSFDQARLQQRQTVAYIFTDGEPSDYADEVYGIEGFIQLVKRIRREARADFFPIGLMPCTNKKSCIKWMNKLDSDNSLGRIQVVDDYFSERKEVYNHHGGLIPYTLGLYLSAALLGPIDQTLDNLDESEIFSRLQLEEFMGYRISSEEYQRYLASAKAAVRNRKRWERGQHPVDILNREPIYLRGQTLYRVGSGYMDADSDDDDDPGMPDIEQCPNCTIL